MERFVTLGTTPHQCLTFATPDAPTLHLLRFPLSKSARPKNMKSTARTNVKTGHLRLVKDEHGTTTAGPLHNHTPEQSAGYRQIAIARATRAATPLTFKFTINADVAPSLRAAIEELSDTLATRLLGSWPFAYEDALTSAMQALGPLRAAINAVVPIADDRWAA